MPQFATNDPRIAEFRVNFRAGLQAVIKAETAQGARFLAGAVVRETQSIGRLPSDVATQNEFADYWGTLRSIEAASRSATKEAMDKAAAGSLERTAAPLIAQVERDEIG